MGLFNFLGGLFGGGGGGYDPTLDYTGYGDIGLDYPTGDIYGGGIDPFEGLGIGSASPDSPPLLGNYLGPTKFGDAFTALGGLGQLGLGIGSILAAANAPKMPKLGSPGLAVMSGYPGLATGFAMANPAMNPRLRAQRRFPGGRADLQAQLGAASISPQLAELMLGQEDDRLSPYLDGQG